MSTVNAMVTIGPRVYYAMAKNRAFLASAAKVHPKWHTPVAAIVAQGVCAMAHDSDAVPAASHIHRLHAEYFRRHERSVPHDLPPPQGWQKLRVVSFAYPLIPVMFILVGIWMIIRGLEFKPFISLAAALTLVTGALVYHFRLRPPVPAPPSIETY